MTPGYRRPHSPHGHNPDHRDRNRSNIAPRPLAPVPSGARRGCLTPGAGTADRSAEGTTRSYPPVTGRTPGRSAVTRAVTCLATGRPGALDAARSAVAAVDNPVLT